MFTAASRLGDATGLPQIPSADPVFNNALATKWYTLYFTRYVNDPSTQQAGIAYWANQIAQDGPARAWANFSTSPQPVADGVAALAVLDTAQYGGPYVLAPAVAVTALPPGGMPTLPPLQPIGLTPSTLTPPPLTTTPLAPKPATTPSLVTPIAPATSTGLSTTTLLLLLAAAVGAFVLVRKSGSGSRSSEGDQ